jgi:hypothetical protein
MLNFRTSPLRISFTTPRRWKLTVDWESTSENVSRGPSEVLPVVALMPDLSENIRLRAGELLRLLVPMPHDFDPSESTQASDAEKFPQMSK